ncbi:MAG TPA: hypothetical protein VHX20_13685 [Terracidiphilus sp.]|nr:hypothetical protein [Terracidiphilus sp.]
MAIAAMAVLLWVSAAVAAQSSQSTPADNRQPAPLKSELPGLGKNHRLILKDGSYQVVREYKIQGDRVHYFSQERGDWEDLPVELVDWDATRKWEQDHAGVDGEGASPAMQEAAAIDKEEADERSDDKARMPEVARGLELPDEDGVFVLDTYQGTPELVELTPKDLRMNSRTHHGLGVLNPLAGEKEGLEIEGAHAKVHLHVNDPAIYLSLDVADSKEPVLSDPFTVDTASAKAAQENSHGARSAQSGFALVKVDERNAMRLVGAIHVSLGGKVTQDEDVIPATTEVLPGKHWLRIMPAQKLVIGGEYALVEILSPSDISDSVWDFRVDPTEGDNPGSLAPILAQKSER